MTEDAKRSATSLFVACATAAAAFALASCSTTSTPIIVDTLSLTDASSANVPDLPAAGNLPLPVSLAAIPDSKPAQSGVFEIASAQNTSADEEDIIAEANATEAVSQPDSAGTGQTVETASADSTAEIVPKARNKSRGDDAGKTGFFASLFEKNGGNVTAETSQTPENNVSQTASAEPESSPADEAVEEQQIATATQESAAETETASATMDSADETDTSQKVDDAAHEKKNGLFASLFKNPSGETAVASAYAGSADRFTSNAQPKARKQKIIKPEAGGGQPVVRRASVTVESDLPGVRQGNLFEITQKASLDDDSDIDVHEEDVPVRMASAAGMARLAPNGLLTQREDVDVSCLKPSLVGVLKAIERKYGAKVVVTSGYRSPSHNRRVRGARHSLHMYCAAADIQVPGVSKWDLAKYVRSMPGRGGVGTYCHTNSIHVDVGPERDWNWRCRRRRS